MLGAGVSATVEPHQTENPHRSSFSMRWNGTQRSDLIIHYSYKTFTIHVLLAALAALHHAAFFLGVKRLTNSALTIVHAAPSMKALFPCW